MQTNTPSPSAYDQGYLAWGESITTNPFSRSEEPEEYDDWNIGYKMAEADFINEFGE